MYPTQLIKICLSIQRYCMGIRAATVVQCLPKLGIIWSWMTLFTSLTICCNCRALYRRPRYAQFSRELWSTSWIRTHPGGLARPGGCCSCSEVFLAGPPFARHGDKTIGSLRMGVSSVGGGDQLQCGRLPSSHEYLPASTTQLCESSACWLLDDVTDIYIHVWVIIQKTPETFYLLSSVHRPASLLRVYCNIQS